MSPETEINMTQKHASTPIKKPQRKGRESKKAWFECRHEDPSLHIPFLTWRAAGAILLQGELGETGALVGAHSVDAEVLAELPPVEQTLIQVIPRQAVGQLGLTADGQRLVVILPL